MINLLNTYKKAKKNLEIRINEIDTDINKSRLNKSKQKELINLRAIYEKELYEVMCVIVEIEDYIKEVTK